MGRRKRRRVDPTDDWQQLELLCVWEEQREYERIRPLVLFGGPRAVGGDRGLGKGALPQDSGLPQGGHGEPLLPAEGQA
ncbi:MAG TPA: hypothetical protein VE525_02495 [Rubrobacter sp.]|jgi:hypothetical protein|nr:hypothetical protein [Rubrobacter sp.]